MFIEMKCVLVCMYAYINMCLLNVFMHACIAAMDLRLVLTSYITSLPHSMPRPLCSF